MTINKIDTPNNPMLLLEIVPALIVVTLSGIVTLRSPAQFKNALEAIVVTPCLIVTFVNELQS